MAGQWKNGSKLRALKMLPTSTTTRADAFPASRQPLTCQERLPAFTLTCCEKRFLVERSCNIPCIIISPMSQEMRESISPNQVRKGAARGTAPVGEGPGRSTQLTRIRSTKGGHPPRSNVPANGHQKLK